eukprot:7017965-Prymnesium_polylepis.1
MTTAVLALPTRVVPEASVQPRPDEGGAPCEECAPEEARGGNGATGVPTGTQYQVRVSAAAALSGHEPLAYAPLDATPEPSPRRGPMAAAPVRCDSRRVGTLFGPERSPRPRSDRGPEPNSRPHRWP